MPLPRTRRSRTTSNTTKASAQSSLEARLCKVPGNLCSDGDILNLPGWCATCYKETDHDLIILAEVAAEQEPACGCETAGAKLQRWGFTPTSYVHDLPMRGKRTRIYFKQQRYRCTCGKTLQQPPSGVDERRKLTIRLAEYIEREAFNIYVTFADLADEVGVSEKTIRDIFTQRAMSLEEERVIEAPRWLAIDEVHLGNKKRCVITDPIRQRALDILPDDSKKALVRWLLQLPNQHQVEVVTMDMSLTYRSAVRRILSHAKIVVDRYHVHNLLNTAIKDVLEVIRGCMSPSEQRKYMRDPRLLLRSRFKLSGDTMIADVSGGKGTQQEIVERWLKEVPDIGEAYRLKEDLSDILQLKDRLKAEEQLDGWLEKVWEFVNRFRAAYEKRCRGEWSEPFRNVVTTISHWRSMILNYIDCKNRFERRVTNAFAEYSNKEIKKAHLRGGGYSYEVLRLKVIYGGLLVGRRPPHPLDEILSGVEKGRKGKHARNGQGNINQKANLVQLKEVHKKKDKTNDLLPRPQDDEAWAARFGQLNQPDLSFEQSEVWEPPKRRRKDHRKEKDNRKSGKRARLPRSRNTGQMKMF
jgi:transposase